MARKTKTYVKQVGETCFTSQESQTRANEMAQEAVGAAFTGHYWPTMLEYRGNELLIWRQPDGWTYRIQWSNDRVSGKAFQFSPNCSSDNETFEEVYKSSTRHLAMVCWNRLDDSPEFVPEFITDSEVRDELIRHHRWQLRYTYFESQGHSNYECHEMASDSRIPAPV